MKYFQTQKVSAWQVRIVALAFIVLSIAGGSHVLVNAFAATTDTSTQTQYSTTDVSVSIPMHVAHSHIVIRHVPAKGSHPVGTLNK